MAQQIQGGGVTYDAGAGVREAGRNISDAGMQLMQQLSLKKELALKSADQARVAFFDNAMKLGMEPQQYASTVGAEEYKNMVNMQGQALNADKIFGNWLQANKPQDANASLQNFNDYQNLSEAARMRMSSNYLSANGGILPEKDQNGQNTQTVNNAPQTTTGTMEGNGQPGSSLQSPLTDSSAQAKYPHMVGGRDNPPPMVNSDVKYPYIPGGRDNPPNIALTVPQIDFTKATSDWNSIKDSFSKFNNSRADRMPEAEASRRKSFDLMYASIPQTGVPSKQVQEAVANELKSRLKYETETIANQRSVTDAPQAIATPDQIRSSPAGMPLSAQIGAGIVQPVSKPGSSVIGGVDYSKSGAVQKPLPTSTPAMTGNGGSFGGAGATGAWRDLNLDISKEPQSVQTEIARQQREGIFDLSKLPLSVKQAYQYQVDAKQLARDAQRTAVGITEKTTPELQKITSQMGAKRAEAIDSKTLAKEVVDTPNPFTLVDVLKSSYQNVISETNQVNPEVPLGATPMATKVVEFNISKARDLGAKAVEQSATISNKMSSGQSITDKDLAVFKATLAQYQGNYAKALQAMNPDISRAIASKNLSDILSMDSVRMQMSGLTDVASKKAAKEALQNNYDIVSMQMNAKVSGDNSLSEMFKNYNLAVKAHQEKYQTVSQNGKLAPEEVYRLMPSLLTEQNSLSMLGGILTAKTTGLSQDPIMLEVDDKGFWHWPWDERYTVKGTPASQSYGQAASDRARQTASASGSSAMNSVLNQAGLSR